MRKITVRNECNIALQMFSVLYIRPVWTTVGERSHIK